MLPILMVDDSEDDFEAARRALSKTGLQNPIEHLSSGQAVIDYLKSGSQKPGLILLDLNMPGLDGRAVLEIIKKDMALRIIPVVVLTTSDNENDIDICYQLGANTYIQKPVNFDKLKEALRQVKEYWIDTALLPRMDLV